MGISDPESRETMSRLALSCSALARAGQVLSTVTDPAKTDEAVGQATAILEIDVRTSRLPQMEAVFRECQSALEGINASERVAACRKLATKLARLASSLATEVQEKSRKSGKAETRPATATRAPAPPSLSKPAEPAPPASPPSKPSERAPAALPPSKPAERAPISATPLARPAKPKFEPTPIRAGQATGDRTGVRAAPGSAARFSIVQGATVVDTQTNLMWAAIPAQPLPHREAGGYASVCALAGYRDWRLPRPEELHQFLTGGGRDLLSAGAAEGRRPPAAALWTSDTRRKWFFIRQAAMVQITSGTLTWVSTRRSDVHVLVVRAGSATR